MADSLAAVVLAAGAGTRLAPLTWVRPKALCPVGDRPLVDHALARVEAVVGTGPDRVAVNAHAHRHQLAAHVAGRAFLSVEEPLALGTAGAVAQLRPWLDGRPVLVVNGDAWAPGHLRSLVEGWDGERVRVLVASDPALPLGPPTRVLGSLLPPRDVAALPAGVSGLTTVCWGPAAAAGRLEQVGGLRPFVDCGRPGDYLEANLAASGGGSVVGQGAEVAGTLERSVVWPGGVVRPGEHLVDAVRVGDWLTVLVR
jgi:N-acetyl-alpha-D-muramate 1-phosphate uridylyltransferase